MGCILYAMLTGKLPFTGTTEEEIIKKICEDDVKFNKK